MRYLLLASVVATLGALSGCSGDSSNSQQIDQIDAQLAADRVSAVIDATANPDTSSPQDIGRISLPAADQAEPVAISDPNASL